MIRDILICEAELPDGFQDKYNKFQTEDLDNNVSTFRISSDGQFYKDGFAWLYTGDFEFFTYQGKMLPKIGYSIYRKYKAFIVEGKLDRIILLEGWDK